MSLDIPPAQKDWSRERYLAEIASARDLASVFELANAAMARREEWGDGLQASAASATKWSSFCFPAFCEKKGAMVRGSLIPREAYLEIGLVGAKAAAAKLLGPIAAVSDEAQALRTWSARNAETEAAATAAGAAAYKKAMGAKSFAASDFYGLEALYASAPQGWEKAAHVKTFEETAIGLLAPHEKTFGADGVSGYKTVDRPQWEAASGSVDAPAQLMAAAGVTFLNSGPAGGMLGLRKGCALLREAYQELSARSGISLGMLGLDLDGLQLNMSQSGSIAFHNPTAKTMGFGPVPCVLGHEWTHLLDASINRQGDAAQKAALAALKSATRSVPPDPELARLYVEDKRDQEAETLGYFLRDKALPEARDAYLAGSPDDPRCAAKFLELCAEACAKGEAEWNRFLIAAWSPAAEPISPEGAKFCYEGIRKACGIDPDPLERESEFMRQAILHDEMGHAKKGYYVSDTEMIARAAESYWAETTQRSCPTLASDKGGRTLPVSTEAAFMSQVYEGLIRSVAANPSAVQSKRRAGAQANSLAANAPKPEPVAAAEPQVDPTRLAGWRQARERADLRASFGKKAGLL